VSQLLLCFSSDRPTIEEIYKETEENLDIKCLVSQ